MITILMPVYNGIEFIEQSVSSIIEQTFTEWDLVIGVNGHEENSSVYQIAKKYENRHSNIRVLDLHTIKGKSNALNHMLQYCENRYVALLDVDDVWMPEKLEIQSLFLYEPCSNFDYDVVGSRCVYFGDIENVVPDIPVGDISRHDFTKVNPIINSSCIIRKELCHWRAEVDGLEDYDLWNRLRYKTPNIRFFNCIDVLVKHRIHKKSAFNNTNHTKVADLLKEYVHV